MTTEGTSRGSVTIVIDELRAGDRGGVPLLWERYFERLARLAGAKVSYRTMPGMFEDEEDAALSALNVFCADLARGKLADVDDRESVWRVLAIITERKALQQVRRWKTVKNGGGRVLPTSVLALGPSTEAHGLDRLQVVAPTPEYVALVKDTLRQFLDSLGNPLWREAVLLRLDGETIPEIAARMKKTERCVYLWFKAIWAIWAERFGDEFFRD